MKIEVKKAFKNRKNRHIIPVYQEVCLVELDNAVVKVKKVNFVFANIRYSRLDRMFTIF